MWTWWKKLWETAPKQIVEHDVGRTEVEIIFDNGETLNVTFLGHLFMWPGIRGGADPMITTSEEKYVRWMKRNGEAMMVMVDSVAYPISRVVKMNVKTTEELVAE